MKRILVPQVVDANNDNAQVLNARAMLARFESTGAEWFALNYSEPDPVLRNSPRVHLTRLWRRHLWYLHKALFYQKPADAIFYPGLYWFDELGLRLRAITGRRVPLVATLEGLVGDEGRERMLSSWAGHPVFCQRVSRPHLARIDRIMRSTDRIVAISPFLERMGRKLYGDKVICVPLGIECNQYERRARDHGKSVRVICIGSFQERKRPELFVDAARAFPHVEFVWFGDGPGRLQVIAKSQQMKLSNIHFPGAVLNRDLPQKLAESDIFVLPSNSEGVPKVTQEAAAASLPIVIFGFYEAPTVVDGRNGYVVWTDDEFVKRVGELIVDRRKASDMGAQGREMARAWSWDKVAPLWEAAILQTMEAN